MAKVKMIAKGRSGTIQYIEGSLFNKRTCEFYWEFGGPGTFAIIWFPNTDAEWDKAYPWAAGRRMEIVKEMAEQIRKQESPSSTLKWEEGTVLLIGR
ncbi:MAG: hypothetical protein IPM31_15410 [Anaerolineae bacterium]|nr:hypothetical protein [Anaerolineae bacterium]MBL8106875.1 hypothetical protein [Anaerolineales bacterium]MCC7187386.1 hypothetical protein [Anaerolineales bacterium]